MRLKQHRPIRPFALTATVAMLALAVTMTFGAGVSFAKTETKEAHYYEDNNFNLCVGLPTSGGFTEGCEWAGMTGVDNVGVGLNVLQSDTDGSFNTAIGLHALLNNTTGKTNTASGSDALASNTTGKSNTASGEVALFS